MILAIDTGNTNIVLGCIENRKIRAVARMATDVNKTDYEYAVGMKNVLAFAGFQPESFEGAILSNVVWPLTSTLCRAVKLLTGLDTLVVGKGLKTGLDIRLDDPGQIGADLVVGAVAALHLHRPPLIVIDMGTATTISAVDAQGRFAGGAIVPGLRLSMESLSGNTSQLPRVSLDAPAKCIGTNTVACMQSGAIYGSAALLDGMIERMETELGAPAAVIATGGSVVYGAEAMAHLRSIGTVVYLRLTCENITERLGDLHARGVTIKPGWTLRDLYNERCPLYEQYADIVQDCDGLRLRDVVAELQKKLKG